MKITLYSTNCGKCRILKEALDQKNISYIVETDRLKMLDLGLRMVPALRVGEVPDVMSFTDAMDWISKQEGA